MGNILSTLDRWVRARGGTPATVTAVAIIVVAAGSPRLAGPRPGSPAAGSRLTAGAPSGSASGTDGSSTEAMADGAAVPGAGGGAGGESRSTRGAGGGARGDAATRGVPMGKGVTATTITVGVVYATNEGAAAAALGVTPSGQSDGDPDQRKQAQVMLDWVNARGGVAGRKLVGEYFPYDYTRAGGAQAQQICDHFTQDVTVFALMEFNSVNNECMGKRQTIAFGITGGSGVYADYPDYIYGPSDFSGDRQLSMYIEGLATANFFASVPSWARTPAKIGVVTFATVHKDLYPRVEALLAKHRLKIDAWGDVANDSSNLQAIVLDFNQKGITHILTPSYGPALFMNHAESQQYRPFYGLNSVQSPTTTATIVSPNQLEGSLVIGWSPSADVDADHQPTLGANWRLCREIMRAKGMADNTSAYVICDAFFAFKRALDPAPEVTVAGLRKTYEAIGIWDSAVTFRSFLGPGKHDGGAGYRLVRYVRETIAKGHYEYVGDVIPY